MNVRTDHVTVFVARVDARGTSHEFLQLRRAAADYLAGSWQLVRGCIEPGETAVAAALRELGEEAGLVPAEFYSLGSVETFYMWHDDFIWHSICFCAIVNRAAPVVLNDEHDASRWIPRAEFDAALTWSSERRILPDLCRDVLDDGLAKPHLHVKLP